METVCESCYHTPCQVARGELPAIAWFNHQFIYECESGWLRDQYRAKRGSQARAALARLYWAMKKTGQFDIMGAVYFGVFVK